MSHGYIYAPLGYGLMNGDSHTAGGTPPDAECDVLADLAGSVADYIAMLTELGIVINTPAAPIEFDPETGRVTIGNLVIASDGVEVYPRFGVTLNQLGELVQQAQLARVSGHDESTGWRLVEGVGWSVAICQMALTTALGATVRRCRSGAARGAQHRVVAG